MKELVYYFHSQHSISIAGEVAEVWLTEVCWEEEEVIRQHKLPNAKLVFMSAETILDKIRC